MYERFELFIPYLTNKRYYSPPASNAVMNGYFGSYFNKSYKCDDTTWISLRGGFNIWIMAGSQLSKYVTDGSSFSSNPVLVISPNMYYKNEIMQTGVEYSVTISVYEPFGIYRA